MDKTQQDRALRFHELHSSGTVLALPNAWDVASALVTAAAGASAVATTSAGVAWSLGAADGNSVDRERVVDLVARVCAAVDVPVTADIEAGFGATAADVADTVARVIAAGAVGVNIEDGLDGALRDRGEQAERHAAARSAADAAGVPLYLNARIDTYLRGIGAPEDRVALTVERAHAYLAAGASGVFVPGAADLDVIRTLVAEIPAPVNILVGPGFPSVPELAGVGVARASLGSAIAEAAYGLAARATEELLSSGTYETVREGKSYSDLNKLF